MTSIKIGDADRGCLAQLPSVRSSTEEICTIFEKYSPSKLSFDNLTAIDLHDTLQGSESLTQVSRASPEVIMASHKQDTYHWLCEHTPDIMRENLPEYLDLLYDNDITTVDRLIRHLPKQEKGWLERLGFHPLDIEDIFAGIAEVKSNPTKRPSSLSLRPQGKEVLAKLLSSVVGLTPKNIEKYSTILIRENIGTVERFQKLLERDGKKMAGLLGSEIDIEEIKQFLESRVISNEHENASKSFLSLSLFAKKGSLTMTTAPTTESSHSANTQANDRNSELKAELQRWIHHHAPDIPVTVLEHYVTILHENEITSIERFLNHLPKRGADWLKSQGFHEFDIEDLLAIRKKDQNDLQLNPFAQRMERMISILHGKEALEEFFASIPGLSPQKVENYAKKLNRESVQIG